MACVGDGMGAFPSCALRMICLKGHTDITYRHATMTDKAAQHAQHVTATQYPVAMRCLLRLQ